jgi:membrane-bound lytic murein transglycosylase B
MTTTRFIVERATRGAATASPDQRAEARQMGASLQAVRAVPAVLLLACSVAAAAATVAGAAGPALPSPDAALPRHAGALAAALTTTTRRLRRAETRWNIARAVPRDVTYLALHHQRLLRWMARHRALGDAALRRLPRDVRGEARDTVLGRRSVDAIPRPGKPPPVRVASAAPAATLRRDYAAAQRRFGIDWSVLAAINLVESSFGRVRSASEAGARGPMQFLPSTWRRYGMGGDIDDPHDAILGAANYLHRSGAPGDLDRALFAYNHSRSYVRAIRRFAHRMHADERVFRTYYAWQVFVRTATGTRRITGPGRKS